MKIFTSVTRSSSSRIDKDRKVNLNRGSHTTLEKKGMMKSCCDASFFYFSDCQCRVYI